MYGIIDCDNCYVSCERVFRPDLKDKPVVVLSNNDGCVVARSNEAKRMGIKAGTPYFQLAELFPNQKIAVFSSNYELYGELTGRVVEIIKKEAPAYFRYSIDECFVYLDGLEKIDLKAWGEELHKKIKRNVGMPVSIGLAPNKTLAKMASHFAKKYQGYRHCCMIDTDEKRIKLFQKNLGTIRKVAGWTAERFGEEIGVTRQTISNLEKGRTPMTKTQYLACRAVLTYEIAESENQGLAQVIRTLVDEPAESTTADVPNAQPFSETGEQEIAAVTTGTIAGLSALTAALAVGISPFAAVVGTAAVRTVAKVASSQMSTKKGE